MLSVVGTIAEMLKPIKYWHERHLIFLLGRSIQLSKVTKLDTKLIIQLSSNI